MARSDAGKALLCGGGSLVTGGAVYFYCVSRIREQDSRIREEKTAKCIILAVASSLADGMVCWWRLSEKIVEDYDQTAETLNYNVAQGNVVKILEFSAEPKVVKPGEVVSIREIYAVMSPNPTDEIHYEQNTTVSGEDNARKLILIHNPGTWGTDGDYSFPIDKNSPEAKIEMVLEIKLLNGGKQDRRTLCFVVSQKDPPDQSNLCPSEKINDVEKNKLFVVSKIKRYTNVCIEPDSGCKSSKSKTFVGVAHVNERFPIIDERKYGSTLWYKIRLQDGREGWLRASTGIVEKN